MNNISKVNEKVFFQVILKTKNMQGGMPITKTEISKIEYKYLERAYYY